MLLVSQPFSNLFRTAEKASDKGMGRLMGRMGRMGKWRRAKLFKLAKSENLLGLAEGNLFLVFYRAGAADAPLAGLGTVTEASRAR